MPSPPLVRAGNPILRTAAAPVSLDQIVTPAFRELVTTMITVMRAAPGVGLAAPQINVPLQVIVLEDSEDGMKQLTAEQRALRERYPFAVTTIVNPVLRVVSDERVTFFEGCLSVNGYTALVERAREVEVTGLNAYGASFQWRVHGWPARILQHEVDHLQGVLYVDRMLTRSLSTIEEAQNRWTQSTIADVMAALGI